MENTWYFVRSGTLQRGKAVSEIFLWALGLSSFWQVWFSGSQRGNRHQQQCESCGRAWAAHPSWEPGNWGSSPFLLRSHLVPCPLPRRSCSLKKENKCLKSSAMFVGLFCCWWITRAPGLAIGAAAMTLTPNQNKYLGCFLPPHPHQHLSPLSLFHQGKDSSCILHPKPGCTQVMAPPGTYTLLFQNVVYQINLLSLCVARVNCASIRILFHRIILKNFRFSYSREHVQ